MTIQKTAQPIAILKPSDQNSVDSKTSTAQPIASVSGRNQSHHIVGMSDEARRLPAQSSDFDYGPSQQQPSEPLIEMLVSRMDPKTIEAYEQGHQKETAQHSDLLTYAKNLSKLDIKYLAGAAQNVAIGGASSFVNFYIFSQIFQTMNALEQGTGQGLLKNQAAAATVLGAVKQVGYQVASALAGGVGFAASSELLSRFLVKPTIQSLTTLLTLGNKVTLVPTPPEQVYPMPSQFHADGVTKKDLSIFQAECTEVEKNRAAFKQQQVDIETNDKGSNLLASMSSFGVMHGARAASQAWADETQKDTLAAAGLALAGAAASSSASGLAQLWATGRKYTAHVLVADPHAASDAQGRPSMVKVPLFMPQMDQTRLSGGTPDGLMTAMLEPFKNAVAATVKEVPTILRGIKVQTDLLKSFALINGAVLPINVGPVFANWAAGKVQNAAGRVALKSGVSALAYFVAIGITQKGLPWVAQSLRDEPKKKLQALTEKALVEALDNFAANGGARYSSLAGEYADAATQTAYLQLDIYKRTKAALEQAVAENSGQGRNSKNLEMGIDQKLLNAYMKEMAPQVEQWQALLLASQTPVRKRSFAQKEIMRTFRNSWDVVKKTLTSWTTRVADDLNQLNSVAVEPSHMPRPHQANTLGEWITGQPLHIAAPRK